MLRDVTPRIGSIAALLYERCPSHISRFVVAIVVDAVKRMTRARTSTDVRKKGSEGVAPFRADGNAPRTVPVVFRILRIFTPLNGLRESVVFWRDLPSSCITVRGHGRNDGLLSNVALKAPTRLTDVVIPSNDSNLRNDLATSKDNHRPAVTAAFESAVRHKFNDRQPLKSLADQVTLAVNHLLIVSASAKRVA